MTEGLLKALEIAESDYKGLVIWSPDDVFSAGANLEALMPVFMKSGGKGIAPEEKKLQDVMLRLRYANVPVVSAMRGIALGGGCELAIYSSRRVAAMESYMGFVEVGVGLVPGGGGLTYIARRAAEMAAAGNANADLFAFLKDGFTSAAMAKVGTSAIENRKLGYLLDSDVIVPHKDELLHVALEQAKSMHESGWRPPLKTLFPVAGRSGIATIKAPARQHARRRLHQPARLPHLVADRRRGVRRRCRRGIAGQRGVPDGARAQALLRAARQREDAGKNHGNAANGQAGAQLRPMTP